MRKGKQLVKNSFAKSFLLIVFLLNTNYTQAQKTDAGLWTAISIDKKLNNKFSANFTEEVRLFQNVQRLNLAYTNLGVSYKLNKYVKLSAVYRFLQKSQDENYISWRHRIYADAQFKYSFLSLLGN